VPIATHPNLLVGTGTGDDAGVYRLGDDTALVLTVDFFPPVIDDPYNYGAIAVANALSDIYAMGGKPLLGLNIVGFPVELPKSILGEILRGGHAKAQEAECLIIGGHTVDDREPKYGLAAVGLVEPGKEVTVAGARPGDRLVLTKPLGTGIITTAGKQERVAPEVMEAAVAVMSTLNRAASEAMVKVGVNACTDVTGFGLIGHLNNMMEASGAEARLRLSEIPVIPGARELLDQGVAPGGTHRNLSGVGSRVRWHQDVSENARLLLCDAQTSGGLLISVPEDRAGALLKELEAAGVAGARVIGELLTDGKKGIQVVP
jgi:selenide,water dikinase